MPNFSKLREAEGKEKKKKVILFDLDKTFLAGDTQWHFFCWIVRSSPFRIFFFLLWIALLPFLALGGKTMMKRFYFSFLFGLSSSQLDRISQNFVRESILPRCYPQMREHLQKWKEKGAFCLLNSASPEFYLKHIGKALGMDAIIGSSLIIEEKMPFFPSLNENNRGREKVFRMQQDFPAWFRNKEDFFFVGYSDSIADIPMLSLCQKIFLVNPDRKMKAKAKKGDWKDWEILDF